MSNYVEYRHMREAAELAALTAKREVEAVSGKAGGLATLGEDGKIPASQIPASAGNETSWYGSTSEFPTTGEVGIIYVDESTGNFYTWNGEKYVSGGGDVDTATEYEMAAMASGMI